MNQQLFSGLWVAWVFFGGVIVWFFLVMFCLAVCLLDCLGLFFFLLLFVVVLFSISESNHA